MTYKMKQNKISYLPTRLGQAILCQDYFIQISSTIFLIYSYYFPDTNTSQDKVDREICILNELLRRVRVV